MKRPDITVHVETLVLDGVAAGDRARVADGLASELGRLLAAQPLPAAWRGSGRVKRLAGPTVLLPVVPVPERTGAQIAASVHAALRKRGR